MAGLVPAGAPNGAGSSPPPGQNNVLEPLMSGEGNMGQRARAFAAQPLVRKALPWFIGLAGVGVAIAGLVLWLIGHGLAVWAAKRDPLFVDVVRRHVRIPGRLGV